MKRVLYLDAGAGVSGDMFVGMLIDLGVDLEFVRRQVAKMGLKELAVAARKVRKGGIEATQFEVLNAIAGGPIEHSGDQPDGARHIHRGLRQIRSLLLAADLTDRVAGDALAVFELLAASEAKVHGVAPEQVHFHEVGALDAIADVVCAVSALRQLAVDTVFCSPLHVGSGTVRCAHGVMPVPAPATAEILRGVPIYSDGCEGELVTPTGAALVRHFCRQYGPMPHMVVERIGYGAGTRDLQRPNVLRGLVGVLAVETEGPICEKGVER